MVSASHVAQAGLEHVILLPLSPEGWDHRCVPQLPVEGYLVPMDCRPDNEGEAGRQRDCSACCFGLSLGNRSPPCTWFLCSNIWVLPGLWEKERLCQSLGVFSSWLKSWLCLRVTEILTHTPAGPADTKVWRQAREHHPPTPARTLGHQVRTPESRSCSGPRLSMMISFFKSSSMVDL